MLIVGCACGISSLGSGPQSTSETASPEPTEAPVLPVSINEGLASLDSYRMTFTSDIYDSSAKQRTVNMGIVARNRGTDASYNRTETHVTGDEEGDISQDLEEQYAIGDQLCSISDGEGELTTISETAQVMSDLMSQVVVFHPLI
jgi:hypothetical protein